MPAHRVPTEQKKSRGTHRADRANPVEPKYAPGEPPMPVSLSPAAQQVWREVVPLLLAQKLLAPVDGGCLESYCRAVSMTRVCDAKLAKLQADETVDEGGFYQGGPSGLWKEHPVAKALREWAPLVERFAKQLGLTPASRAAVTPVPAGEEEDELERLLRESKAGPN